MSRHCYTVMALVVVSVLVLCPNGALAGLVAHWSFNNESDPGYDDTGNGHQADLHGAQWVDLSGGDGGLSFDGLNDYVAAFTSTQDLAYRFDQYRVIVRFKSDDLTNGTLIQRAGPAGITESVNFRIANWGGESAGQLHGTHEINAGQNVSVFTDPSFALNDGVWHTVELRYDGIHMGIYRDGHLDQEIACGPSAYPSYDSDPVMIGGHPSNSYYFDGVITDVQLWDVPEPTSIVLLALGGLALMRRRKLRA